MSNPGTDLNDLRWRPTRHVRVLDRARYIRRHIADLDPEHRREVLAELEPVLHEDGAE